MPTAHLQPVQDSHFPIACPKCRKDAGVPYIAGTSVASDRIIVGVRCQDCTHEWNLEMPHESSDGTGILMPW